MKLVDDVHERISPVKAVSLAKGLEPYELFFLEDPVLIEQTEWLRRLRGQTDIPIADGELFNHPSEWKTLITERSD